MTRLELLHTIQENGELLTLQDAFSLLAGRLPENDARVSDAWENLYQALTANDVRQYV
jgi:hypothetical protein